MTCFIVADDDELTFDPGETITNIEFVSKQNQILK